jgi:phospholipase D-like protein
MNWWQGFVLVFIAIPLIVLWVAIVIDLFRRRDLSGLKIATWVVLLLIFPIVSALIYLAVRPRAPLFGSSESSLEDRVATQNALTYDTPGESLGGPRTTIPPRAR